MLRVRQDLHRLIPSRFPPIDVYARLGPPELGAIAKGIESKTNPRLRAKDRLTGMAGVDDASPRLQNWNHAPFAYSNPEGSTFLNPAYGVLEVTDGAHAALYWALLRREEFLQRTEEPPLDVDMRLLVTPVDGEFIDISNTPPDPDRNRRWALGRELYENGAKGVLFRRPRLPRALAFAVFDSTVLGRSVQSTHYRFSWDGKKVRLIYDFSSGEEILREDLARELEGTVESDRQVVCRMPTRNSREA